jgi:PPM family protein phosphatase
MKFSVFQLSRIGGRAVNQDRMGYSYTRNAGFFLVADGLGGHPQGEVASQMALQVMSGLFQSDSKTGIDDVYAFLETAIKIADRKIHRYSIEKNMPDSPRTTLVAALIQEGGISWIHCGDSRLYLVRDGELLAKTRDHSYIEQKQGDSTDEKLSEGVNRNMLYTCLGSPIPPVFEITGPIGLKEGDKILLCSDGLWGSLSDVEIAYDLATKTVADAVRDLVEKALTKAGSSSDNVTALAIEWETPDAFEATHVSVSTENLEEGVFASTVQASGFETLTEDLNDEEIERSIAEINDAIRRSSVKKK